VIKLFSKSEFRDLSLLLAFVMLLASAPSATGLVNVSRPIHGELTINICQPLQTFDRVSNVLLALPLKVMPDFELGDVGSTAIRNDPHTVDFRVPPDTPPPKRSV
jgi:hypothetical protein